ncbi:family 43 glycosylhydrolase [Rufibacter sediminis]|uniref:Glycoside hydrolase family 43 protein n=1 Tax=Rufibacter sediminis TaxID=2762756 RepID=A0ABR6VUW1_9BACT|nr:glycoside hydrolase family 43 protein [Rufibacter sediminis]MBC3540955.1 glycoside hydrolase family 43 protein [Rufibacter sediminis]
MKRAETGAKRVWKPNLWLLLGWVLLFAQCGGSDEDPQVTPTPEASPTFTNPLIASGPDPWVFQQGDTYYYTHTLGNRIGLIKTKAISQLKDERFTTVWTPPATGAYSKNIWAPELHQIAGKWYFYFAADDGNDANHRMYVLENASADPTTGTWEFKGKIATPSDKWAIDGSVLEHQGQQYFVWSGWEGDNSPGIQQIYIARMANPWTLEGERVMITRPTLNWEMNGLVNEGPQALKNSAGKLFLTYSASGCWTDSYALGRLTLRDNGNPLNPDDWMKSPTPVLATKAENNAFGPGHNGFFKSPDGTEDWIIYHANSARDQGCGNTRNPRIQKFTWNADGTPNFGEPAKTNVPITRPSGEVQ